jgi:hypothetical protein
MACAQLSAAEAKRIHGPDGDDCWRATRCPRRRSHYRNRRDNNAKRRAERIAVRPRPTVEHLTVATPTPTVAYLYLYRAKRQDAPLHAIAVSVWRGSQPVLEIEPIHCAGLRNRQINQYLKDVLEQLNSRYGISEFEAQVRLEPAECPLEACPLRQKPGEAV